MKIQVTQAHINAGIRFNEASCPIALAIKEATGCSSVAVSSRILLDRVYHQVIPLKVFIKLTHFDHTGELEPFDFEIKDLP